MPELHTLKDLLIEELKDLYDAETQLVKALPKFAKAASNSELKEGFENHLEQTKDHVNRLERAFEILSVSPKRKTCHAMKGLVEEGSEAISTEAPDSVRDASLIGAAQRLEHYEIAAYGTASAHAEELGLMDVVDLLEATLDEEQMCNENLTQIAEGGVNRDAAAAEERKRGRASRAEGRAAKRRS
jgi:ferritin-like metal-binding protein YciE